MGAADRSIRSKRAPDHYSPEPDSLRAQRTNRKRKSGKSASKPSKASKFTKNTRKTIAKSKKPPKAPAVAATTPSKPKRGPPKPRAFTPPPAKKRRNVSFKPAGHRPKKYSTPEAGSVSPISPPLRVKVKRGSK
ncbi:hypothetical protein OEA41_007088 [Lepraria neglecta]|uniref:Uncharacterized protein n=1 Tax=Lepraria neglecta TaxID=209136 RepID=A0AAE0DL54_9LECA|nr:hypothetical protein OEA41_007088 [Lepraria neglecta]